jgi:RNA methyltransferase, TrmH family
MLSQNQVKQITALKVKKFREEQNQFMAEGHKLVMDLLYSDFKISGIYAVAEWIVANISVIREKNIPVFETLPREMDRISALSTPSPVLAIAGIPAPAFPFKKEQGRDCLILVLDNIRDPGNLGTIIRIADWFGIYTVLCSENCVDIYNPKVVQATMGSIARVKVIGCNLFDILSTPAVATIDIPVYGTFLEGIPIFSQTLSNHGIILIGNESRGISPELIPFITRKLFIPSFGESASGKAESLNASIAAAIICAEFRRNMKY